MNICFLHGGFAFYGGIGRVVSTLVNELSKNTNWQIFSLSYFNSHRPNCFEISSRVYDHYLFDNPINMKKGLLKGGIRKMRSYIRKYRIDIVISCGVLYNILAIEACKFTNTKCIVWEHTSPNTTSDYPFQWLCRIYGASKSSCNVLISKSAKEMYDKRFRRARNITIYNPIDPKLFDRKVNYSINSKKIISVGRLSYPKNFGIIVDIAKIVMSKYPDWKWDIYGDGEEREMLQNKISDAGLENVVTLRGTTNDIYNIYNDYSFIVMTSRYEGFPMVLLEGAANGLPMVSFDILTGPNEIIEDQKNGFLVEAGNINQMAKCIEFLIENPQARIKMSNNAYAKSKEFSIENIKNKWEEVLYEIEKSKFMV